jgi:radical SAM protein with 4Fe4S-binding SPASM domain
MRLCGRRKITQVFSKRTRIPKRQLYHKRGEEGRFRGYRLHLRVSEDGSGMLIINASRIIHLNSTAVDYAKFMMEERQDEEVAREICRRYRVTRQQAMEDYRKVSNKIFDIATAKKIVPETFLGMDRIDAFSIPLTAPYRSDVVLTYRCNNHCTHCYVGREKPFPEMGTAEWKRAIRALWEAGIPHITFTGGEPTLRDDLAELVGFAEEIGLVTGLITNGRLLEHDLVQQLVSAGLDHVQITIESFKEVTHNRMVGAPAWRETVRGIEHCLSTPLYVLTNTTLTRENSGEITGTVSFLKSLGLERFAYNSLIYSGNGCAVGTGIAEEELGSFVRSIKRSAQEHGMDFIWYTPTHYCVFDPCVEGVGLKQCSAARYNIAVEPNGDVIPCQSYFETMGNILTDPWKHIWNSDVALFLRNREYIEEKCKVCPDLNLCGNGCPLYNRARTQPVSCGKG